MLFQPSNITPDLLSGFGSGTVDATAAASVTWQVNGTDAMTAYSITIMRNNAASTVVYNTGTVSISPFYGTDEKGNKVPYTHNFGVSWASLGLSNGNDYKLSITQYWNGTSNSVTQYSASAFITRTVPTCSITVPNTVTSVYQEITGAYSQAQNDGIAFAQWVFSYIDGDGVETVIKDTGNITTGVLSFKADGLITGNIYKIALTVTSVNGQTVSTSKQFYVSYSTVSPENSINGEWTSEGAVELYWGKQVTIEGDATGAYLPTASSILLPNGSYVEYDTVGSDPMSFAAPFSAYLKTKVTEPYPVLDMITGTLTTQAISKDGNYLAVANTSGFKVYSVTASAVSLVSSFTLSGVSCMCFMNDNTTLIVGGNFGSSYLKVYTNGGSSYSLAYTVSDSDIPYPVQCIAVGGNTRTAVFCGASSNYFGLSCEITTSAFSRLDTIFVNGSTFSDKPQSCVYISTGYIIFGTTNGLYQYSVDSGGGVSFIRKTETGASVSNLVLGNTLVLTAAGKVRIATADRTSTLGTSMTNISGVACMDGSSKYVAISATYATFFTVTMDGNDPSYTITATLDLSDHSYYFFAVSAAQSRLFALNGISYYIGINTDAESSLLKLQFSSGDIEITQDGTHLYYYENSVLKFSADKAATNAFEVISITPTSVTLSSVTPTQYFSTAQDTITSVTIYGAQEVDYLIVMMGSATPAANPVFDGDTYMCDTFDNGSLSAGPGVFSGGYIYRLEENTPILASVLPYAEALAGDNHIRDYGVRACTQYTYEVFFSKNNGATVSNAILSENFKRPFGCVYLYEATLDANDASVYHVLRSWRFNSAYKIDAQTNGNQPTYFQNFTPYRLRQKSRQNAKSGTLSALLGRTTQQEYYDSVRMMDELNAASLSDNVFFIKEPKGQLMMVHISAPVRESVNYKTLPKQVTISISFEEVGDASQVSLIQLQTDPNWNDPKINA